MQDALASLLHTTFGEYVEGLHNLDTSKFPLTLRDLKLKPNKIQEELDEDGAFPFDITDGRIGSISVNPGWMGTVEVVASGIVLNFAFSPMKAMKAAMKGPEQEQQHYEARAGPPPAPAAPVAPRYCSQHSTSEHRTKVEPRFRECSSCRLRVQTNYEDFTLCPPCSDKEHRCMLCGKNAPQAGSYVPAVTANGPCQHDNGLPPPPPGSDRQNRDRRESDRWGGGDRSGHGRANEDGLPPPPPPPPRGAGRQGQGQDDKDMYAPPPSRGGQYGDPRDRDQDPSWRSTSAAQNPRDMPFGGAPPSARGPLSPSGQGSLDSYRPPRDNMKGQGGGLGGYSPGPARGPPGPPRGLYSPAGPNQDGGLFDGLWKMLHMQWGSLQGSCMNNGPGHYHDDRMGQADPYGRGGRQMQGPGTRAAPQGPGTRAAPPDHAWRGGA